MKLACGALALVGVSGCVLFAFYQHWELADPPVAAILLCMLPVQLGAIVVARRVFAVKDRWMVFVAIFVGVYVLFGHVAALNAWLDGAPRSRHRVKVIERNHHRGAFRSTVVESWHARGETVTLWAPTLVDGLPEVVVVTGEGAFGLEWIDDVEAPDLNPAW